jgi:hypothetical protein
MLKDIGSVLTLDTLIVLTLLSYPDEVARVGAYDRPQPLMPGAPRIATVNSFDLRGVAVPVAFSSLL